MCVKRKLLRVSSSFKTNFIQISEFYVADMVLKVLTLKSRKPAEEQECRMAIMLPSSEKTFLLFSSKVIRRQLFLWKSHGDMQPETFPIIVNESSNSALLPRLREDGTENIGKAAHYQSTFCCTLNINKHKIKNRILIFMHQNNQHMNRDIACNFPHCDKINSF